jgi:hypothetical protein
MTKRTIETSLLALAMLALAGCDATQPAPLCRAQTAQYGARYIVEGTPQGACTGKVLTGELLNLQYYRAPLEEAAGTTSVAIEPQSVADAVKAGATGTEYSIGRYTANQPDGENLCRAPTLSQTSIMVGANPISYQWSNVQMMVTPVSNNIHFGADLVRRDGDCTVTYKVSAVYPAKYCGDGRDQMGMPDPTTGKADPTACDATILGSGLSPDLAYQCDVTADGASGTRLCLPAKAFPAYK